MTTQALTSANGVVTNPYAQAQASVAMPIPQDYMVQNSIMTGTSPLASAVGPSRSESIATSQVYATPHPVKPTQGTTKMASNPPAPTGCGSKLDIQA